MYIRFKNLNKNINLEKNVLSTKKKNDQAYLSFLFLINSF